MSLIIVVQNVTELKPVSDYRYEVLIGDGTKERSKTIAAGKIKGHTRADGWQALVKRVLDQEQDEL